MMLRLLLLALLAGSACNRGPASDAPPSGPLGTAAAPRRVAVRVSNQGYTPARIIGRPGETLVLSFRYERSAGECGREVLLPGGARLRLVEGQDIEGTVQLPAQKSELTFTCGMNMLSGTLVVQ